MEGKVRKSYMRYRPFFAQSTSQLQEAKRAGIPTLPIPGNGDRLKDTSHAWGRKRQGSTWMMPKWQFMRLDPFGGADKEVFAGNLLFAIGFGRELDMPHPPRCRLLRPTFENQRLELYTVRAHIYQARDLPSADENGSSDPYVMLRVGGHPYQMTKTKPQTRFPVWYETLEFQGVALPSPDDITRSLGPMMTLLVMDEDPSLLSTDRDGDFLGRVQIPSSRVNQANMPARPTWSPVFSGNSNRAQGELLVSFQLIPSALRLDRFPLVNLTPPMRPCTIEIVLLGVRGLINSSITKSEPRYIKLNVEGIELAEEASSHTTKKSNQPTQENPNFLEMIRIKAALPTDAMFLPVVNVCVMEAAFFGLAESTLATCAIDLSPYIPWDPKARQLMELKAGMGVQDENPDAEPEPELEPVPELEPQPEPEPEPEPQLEPEPEPEPEVLLEQVQLIPVAGGSQLNAMSNSADRDPSSRATYEVDPAQFADSNDDGSTSSRKFWSRRSKPEVVNIPLSEMEKSRDKKEAALREKHAAVRARNRNKRAASSRAGSVAPTEDVYDFAEAWTKGRVMHDDELEDVMKSPNRGSPFEEWTLVAGQAKGEGAAEYSAGELKALISIIPQDDPGSRVAFPMDAKALLRQRPESLLVRVYVINATGLVSRDANGGSDPYLKLRVGRKEHNDSKNRKSETLNPEFRSMFEFEVGLPGEAELHLEVYDWDLLGFDEMIGATTIDLENRWFSKEWRAMGAAKTKKEPNKRPLETRTLHVPGRRAPQGKVRLWVDILPRNEVKCNPPVDITRPEMEEFELRVCVFRGKRLPLMDSGDLADFFAVVNVEGTYDDDSQSVFHMKEETDTHFRAKGRKATWNWRCKFEMKGPTKYARLRLQVYDFDIVGASDICGEWMCADLQGMMRRAVGRWRAGQKGTPKIVSFPKNIQGKHDREWVRLTNAQGEPAGEVEVQMQLVHKDLWKQHPAGVGRAAPNSNPKLMDPPDRMDLNMLRPDQMLKGTQLRVILGSLP